MFAHSELLKHFTKKTLNFHCVGVEVSFSVTCHCACRNDFNAPDSLDAPHQQDAARHSDTHDKVFDQSFRCQILLPGPGSQDMRTGRPTETSAAGSQFITSIRLVFGAFRLLLIRGDWLFLLESKPVEWAICLLVNPPRLVAISTQINPDPTSVRISSAKSSNTCHDLLPLCRHLYPIWKVK